MDVQCKAFSVFKCDIHVCSYFDLLYTHKFSLYDTVNFTECDSDFQITTLWVSVLQLFEYDDQVHIKYRLYLSEF